MTTNETPADMAAIRAARDAEYRADVAKATDSFTAYWAGSAYASAVRDVRAGRVRTIRAR